MADNDVEDEEEEEEEERVGSAWLSQLLPAVSCLV